MEIINSYEHEGCCHFDKSDKPVIELVRIAKGSKRDLYINFNKVVFIMEGRLRFYFSDFPNIECMKGQILFLPSGSQYSFQATMPTVVMVFRILDSIHLCDNFSMEELYENKKNSEDSHKPNTRSFSVLDINTRIWHLLDGINDSLADGIRCRKYFDLKIREFFMLLRIYYPKEEIYDFLYLILSGDTAFSEYVRLYWHRFHNVAEIAESLNITARQFSSKFKAVFGLTPYKWMKEGRAKSIKQQLITTKKPIKQIAFENGFSDIPQFTKFCKKEIGKTPTEIRTGKTRK